MTSHITTPFGAESTAADVIAGVDLSGKTAIVTGASSGIGVETARALAGAGAAVTLAVRDTAAGDRVAAEIRAGTGNTSVSVGALDLSDLTSVAAFVRAWTGPLDILVANAGVMAIQELTMSPSGNEMQFATNHLGHFALADGQSKTANVLFAVEATRRWADHGITSNALMPGGILTPLQRHLPPDYGKQAEERFRKAGSRLKTVEQGAATSVLLAASPLLDGISGRYFEDCNEAPVVLRRSETTIAGVAPYALDPANAERLWELSSKLI